MDSLTPSPGDSPAMVAAKECLAFAEAARTARLRAVAAANPAEAHAAAGDALEAALQAWRTAEPWQESADADARNVTAITAEAATHSAMVAVEACSRWRHDARATVSL